MRFPAGSFVWVNFTNHELKIKGRGVVLDDTGPMVTVAAECVEHRASRIVMNPGTIVMLPPGVLSKLTGMQYQMAKYADMRPKQFAEEMAQLLDIIGG